MNFIFCNLKKPQNMHFIFCKLKKPQKTSLTPTSSPSQCPSLVPSFVFERDFSVKKKVVKITKARSFMAKHDRFVLHDFSAKLFACNEVNKNHNISMKKEFFENREGSFILVQVQMYFAPLQKGFCRFRI